MANLTLKPSILIVLVISRLMSIVGFKERPAFAYLPTELLSLGIASRLRLDEPALIMASADFGNLVHLTPAAVFYPSSVDDIVSLVEFSYNKSFPFKVAARGQGHSLRGQAMAERGIVIDMPSLSKHKHNNYHHHDYDNYYHYKYYDNNGGRIRVWYDPSLGFYADVGGEQLWIDLLHATLEYGVSPVSWTDYLYLSVGGTLSNAGISGQTFRYGPQISNVYELDVVNGKGELVTCSRRKNQELFYAVLGGLGQFGIITRARIALEAAPKRVKWVRMLYDDFSKFTRDQETLITINGDRGLSNIHGLNYVEGSLMLLQVSPNNWRSSFFSPSDVAKITSLRTSNGTYNGVIYSLEVVKYYYDNSDYADIDEELELQFQGLSFLPGFIFTKDVSYVEFLNRVRRDELNQQSKGLWDVPHPWLNLFIPRSQIHDFAPVFSNIIANNDNATGPILVYPMNKIKWDDNMSAVTPDEDVFYTVGFLHSNGYNGWQALEGLNKEILKFCDQNGIKVKQYLPHYSTKKEWKSHFGPKWQIFKHRKALFDPKLILSPGQRIFT